MSSTQRIFLSLGVMIAAVLGYLVFQSSVQEVETKPRSGEEALTPTYKEGKGREFASDKIIVKIEEEASQSDLEAINRRNDARTEEDLPRSDVSVVDLPRDLPVDEAIDRYEASPDVEYAEPDFLLKPAQTTSPDDPSYPKLYGLNNTGQSGGSADADIDAPDAWGMTTGNPSVVVAVIDEGVDIRHPDLASNIWKNPGESGSGKETNGIDDDRNGYVDDVNGYDFANNDNSVYDPDPVSGAGDEHGTHVAGTIAARGNNSVGVTGVGWQTQIMPLKFLGKNGGYTSDAVEAINYAVAKGVKISNNSWGGGGFSQSLSDAISRADAQGHLFVAAAGNGGADGVGDDNDAAPHYPSNYNNPNVVSVAASDDKDALASFSNYGSTSVDVAAPGVRILSTLPGNAYGAYSGTSMATPHVAGAAALIKSSDPALDDAGIKANLLQSVDKKTNLSGKTATGGRLNAAEALGTTDSTPDTKAPVAEAPAQSFATPSTLGTSAVPVKLAWSASDEAGGSGVASYQLQQSTNGGAYSNVTLPSATATTLTPSLTPNYTYRYRVAAKDKEGNVSDWAYGPSFKVNSYQENAAEVVYSGGTWTRAYLSGSYGSYVKYATGAGATAKLTFTGRDVAWVAPKSNTRGKADVYVDGAYVQTVDLYSSTTQARQVVFAKSWATSGSHTLEVRVLGTDGRPRVDTDAFVVLS